MSRETDALWESILAWVEREDRVKSAVLFGSSARSSPEISAGDQWSDFDLHLVARNASQLERLDWSSDFAGLGFCLQVVRPATGGVRKISALFDGGQIDMVLVPSGAMRFARALMRCGLHNRWRIPKIALNEMATCLHTGYRFLKGEAQWGKFYQDVALQMTGVRIADVEIAQLADTFLCDLLWIFQKIERGELIAAQHALHRHLSETNLRLLRELRLRRKLSLPSFGLGRRVEMLNSPDEQQYVSVSAKLERSELQIAAWNSFDGMKALVRELQPDWIVPKRYLELLRVYTRRTELRNFTPAS